MAKRRNRTPEENARREKIRELLQVANVSSMDDMVDLKAVYTAVDEPAAMNAPDITKKWTGRRQDWSIIYSQLSVYFEDRMPN